MPPEWQRRMLREVIGIAKRQAKAIVDHRMEHHSILLVLTGGKRRPSYGVHPLHPLPWQSLNEALTEALHETDAWGIATSTKPGWPMARRSSGHRWTA